MIGGDSLWFWLRLVDAAEPAAVKVPDDISEIAAKRWEARQAKDWAASDIFRDELAAKGWVVKDGREGYEVVPL